LYGYQLYNICLEVQCSRVTAVAEAYTSLVPLIDSNMLPYEIMNEYDMVFYALKHYEIYHFV